MSDWVALAARLMTTPGPDSALDAAVAEAFEVPAASFSASVEDCRRLAATALPNWRLHVGFGVSGVLPYAALTNGEDRATAEAPTVPLAILRAVVEGVKLRKS